MLNFGHDANRTPDCFDDNAYQGFQPTCAVRSQELILRDFGIQIPQAELRDYAEQQGWFDGGTAMCDIGNLLNTCGVGTHSSLDNNVYDLINEMQQGHRVIVAVDAKELWAEPGSLKCKFYQMLDNPNHALIVAGVNVDIDDPSKSTVVLTDPGKGDVYIEYNMNHFVQAWKDSNFYMMATDEAAPYQYNEETGHMELSNFATNYSLAEFPFHNEFSNIYELASDNNYVPYYADGHMFQIADGVSYEDFMQNWNDENLNNLSSLFGTELVAQDLDNVSMKDEHIIAICADNICTPVEEYEDPIQEPIPLDVDFEQLS